MKDSKLNNNQKPLSEEEIKNAENFADVLNQFNAGKTSYLKKYWHYLSAGAILLIAALLVKNNSDTEKEKNTTDSFRIVAPIEGVDTPFGKHVVNANEEGVIVLESGTVLRFPKNAFTDENGKPVSGNVEILFREFHAIPEIFASGIPMTYDSANTQYHFESAGMFEMRGSQNGKPVNINPENPVIVELASKQNGDYFNLYYLDDNGKWNFIKKDTTKGSQEILVTDINDNDKNDKLSALLKSEKQAQKELKKAESKFEKTIQKNIGYRPVKANDNLYSIQLEYDEKQFPELVPFKGILFEITKDNEDFTPELAQKDWDEIKLKKQLDGDYQLIMFDEQKKYKFMVQPVVSSKDLQAANITFDNLFDVYDEKLGGRLSEEKKIVDSLKLANKQISDSVANLNRVATSLSYRNDSIGESTNNVYRVFSAEKFGVYNSDCPRNLPKGALFQPVFVNNARKEDTLSFDHIYMAELKKNTLYSLYGYWGKPKEKSDEKYLADEISYNPYQKTVVWGITTDNRLGIITPKEMANLKSGGGMDVGMLVVKEKVTDIEKLRKLLGF